MSSIVETKQQREKKEKKEKSSKKRKANELLDAAGQPDSAKAEADLDISSATSAVAAKTRDAINGNNEQSPSKKRKQNVEEIEKGKPLPPSKNDSDTEEKKKEKEKKKAAVEKRSEHGIWVGNLAFSISKADLREFFVSNSDITEEMITRVHMPSPDDNKPANQVEENKFGKKVHNKGFAYVDFSTPEAVDKAVALSEKLLSGRRVLIKNNKSFEGRPEKPKEETKNDGKPPSKRVFLGNLSFDTTEESLKQHFEKCGPIESIKIATFEDSGKCKGYAWIVFEELEAAQNAVRGFVHIEEEDPDASDSDEDEPGSSDEAAVEEETLDSKRKKTKRRKWWVNKIKGRPLRMEFAEDAQVRYKKRYGKDGTKANAERTVSSAGQDDAKDNQVAVKLKKVEYRQPYAARLTGGIVESKGEKITF
ncbi:hypothetical protein B7463_g5367, partial [Scytalidium lignicola]